MFHSTRLRAFAVCALTVAAPLALPVYADDVSQPKADVSVRISGTSRAARSGVSQSVATHTLVVGQASVIGVHGNFDGAIGSGGWPGGGNTEYAWRVEVRLLSARFETVELAVTWRRYAPGARDDDAAGPGDRRVLKLSADQRHVLDLVHADSPTSDLANLVVEVEASRAGEPAEGVVLDEGMWLVHEDRAGKKTTQHRSYGGYQGTTIGAFVFTPLGFTLDGELAGSAAAAPLSVSVKARLTARLRSDGSFDVTLATEAALACGRGSTGGGGIKEFVAHDGETVAVEVPLVMGWCTIDGSHAIPQGGTPGVKDTPAGLRVSSQEFFEGDRLSLLVRVRRMR